EERPALRVGERCRPPRLDAQHRIAFLRGVKLQDRLAEHRIEYVALAEEPCRQHIEQAFAIVADFEPTGGEKLGEALEIFARGGTPKSVVKAAGEKATTAIERRNPQMLRLERDTRHLGASVTDQRHLGAQFHHLAELRREVAAKGRMPGR